MECWSAERGPPRRPRPQVRIDSEDDEDNTKFMVINYLRDHSENIQGCVLVERKVCDQREFCMTMILAAAACCCLLFVFAASIAAAIPRNRVSSSVESK